MALDRSISSARGDLLGDMLDRRALQLVERPVAPQPPKCDTTRSEELGAAGYALSSRHCLTRSLAIPLSPIAINNNHAISAVLHVDSPAEVHLLPTYAQNQGDLKGRTDQRCSITRLRRVI